MSPKKDFYSILGIERNASTEEVHKAYLEAAKQLHPDKNLAPGETELFLEAQEAYDTLSNPKKRAKYDPTLPPEKKPESPLIQKIQFSRSCLLRLNEPQIIYVLAEYAIPAGIKAAAARPLNLCLVLDRSTSMQGHKMDMVKATAIQIMRRLKPQDIFSVVTFSDRAEVLISANRGLDLHKEEARIQMIQPSGGTEVFNGLDLGYNEIIRNVTRSQINHIILLTDGRTYGDEDKCINLARQAAEYGIGISGLGVGSEWNDNFLDELSSITGGVSMYVPRPEDIQHALLDRFTQLSTTYSEEVRLEYEKNDLAELEYAFRLYPQAGLLPCDSPMLLGPVMEDKNLTIIMEFVVQPQILKNNPVCFFDGKLIVTQTGQQSAIKPIQSRFTLPVRLDNDPEPPAAEIIDALSKLKLYRLQEQARLDVKEGNFEEAVEHLSRLATHLLAQGERELARTVLIEADNVQKERAFSQQGGKEIKYGTRALLMSGK
jgi:Ca-activated chloride channel homolog